MPDNYHAWLADAQLPISYQDAIQRERSSLHIQTPIRSTLAKYKGVCMACGNYCFCSVIHKYYCTVDVLIYTRINLYDFRIFKENVYFRPCKLNNRFLVQVNEQNQARHKAFYFIFYRNLLLE